MSRYYARPYLKTTICLLIAGISAVVPVPDTRAAESPLAPAVPELFVVFIGGMDSDPTPAEIAGTERENRGNSGMFQLCRKLNDDRLACEYFNWNGTRAGNIDAKNPPFAASIVARIQEQIRQYPRSQIAIVGNSWGGHTAWQVADELSRCDCPLAIKQVVFVDASSTGRALDRHPQRLPINVHRAIHYYTHNIYCWGPWPDDRIHTVDLGNPELGYCKDGTPNYASKFDFQAHVAAEWDPRIHAEIKDTVMKLLHTR